MLKDKKQIFKYIGPGIVGLLFNSLYIIVDGIFVAKMLGSNALAAVTVVVPIVEILIALSLMISIGCGVYISSHYGKGNLEESRNYFNHGMRITLVVSIGITLLFLLFHNPIIKLLGTTDIIYEETRSYFIWFTAFIPFFMFNYALGTWVRNDGSPELAMIGQVVGAILNVVLDYTFMGPLNWGIKGAAIATGLGPVIGIIILMPHFIRKTGNLYLEKIKFEFKKVKHIMLGGLPSFAIEFSLGIMTFFCNLFIAARFKEAGLSAFGIIGYINLIVLSVYLGIGQGTQPLISSFSGQKDYDSIYEIYKLSLKIAVFTGIFSYIILALNKSFVVGIFIDKNNPAVMDLSIRAINLFFVSLPITGINVLTASLFEAKQNIVPSVIISFARSAIFLVPSLFVLNYFSNPMLLWLAVPITEFISLFLCIYLLKYVKSMDDLSLENSSKPVKN